VAEAQYGYGNGYYGRRQSAVPRADEPVKKAEPLTAEEIVQNEMPQITEALELNDFEQAVVSTILTKYIQQHIELQLLKLDADQIREGLEKIRINQEAELKAGLPEDKYNAFVELQKNGFRKNKKSKKKRKNKKDDSGE
jgi:hypothetical protein